MHASALKACARADVAIQVYAFQMNTELAELLERVRDWSAERQEDVVHVLEGMEESGTKIHQVMKDEERAIQEGLDSALVSDDVVAAFRNRHA